MSSSEYRGSVQSIAMLRRTLKESLVSFGVIGVAVGIAAAAFPADVAIGWPLLWSAIAVSIASGALRARPKREFGVGFKHPATNIRIKVGDLFDQRGHLVIGFSDTFDTELGDVVSPESIQGQFLTRIYRGDRNRLDRDLDVALKSHSGTIDHSKSRGKKKRYDLGTTVTLIGEGRNFVCCAYSRLHADTLMADSDIDTIWASLGAIWNEVQVRGEQKPIAIPIVGSFLSRVGGGSCALLVRLILLSYFVHSRVKPIARELTLVVSERDLEKVNLVELEEFVRTLNC